MAGMNATYDSSLDPATKDAIKEMVDRLNSAISTRTVNLNVTSDVSQLHPANLEVALEP
jgi:hypothetical protein